MIRKFVLMLAVVGLVSGGGFAGATTIGFDTTAAGPIGVGEFAAFGVTFTNASVANDPPFYTSPTRSIISTSGGFDFLAADAVGATFSSVANFVSINGINVGFNGLRLEAYDAANVLVDFDEVFGTTEGGIAGGGAGEIFALSVSNPSIARVSIFQVTGEYSDTIVLDDFTFDRVPEPGTLALLGLGLAGLAATRRRRD